jgi:hypothetical protein
LRELAARETIHICQKHVKEVCPDGFVKFWLPAFDALRVKEATICPTCKGFFPRRATDTWLKYCYGCYRGESPTSHSKADIDKATPALPTWLRQVTSTTVATTDLGREAQ